jgi:prophage tail gpP-like protein
MKIIEVNEGTKIEYALSKYKLTLGDAIMLSLNKYQRDWPVAVDVMADADGNLIVGGGGRFYVAQVQIPAIAYVEAEADAAAESTETGTAACGPTMTPVPLNTDDVTLSLWSIDGINII